MNSLKYLDRTTKKTHEEAIYFGEAVRFLYGKGWLSQIFGKPITTLISRFPFFSALFGWWNNQPFTKKKIQPFIERYHIDPTEFQESIDRFTSFNDFFTRHLKPEARPIAKKSNVAIIPADGRYLFFPDISQSEGFLIKGEKFNLVDLLQDPAPANHYEKGTMVIARLCPTDYHRYHFPVDCIPSKPKFINGYLYSVNPIALWQDIHILTKNKRVITTLDSEEFGKVQFIEVGATNVGSINQTYTPEIPHKKGEEKGYFAFGASTLILLFEPGRIQLDSDLLNSPIEIRCLMGQSMGLSTARL